MERWPRQTNGRRRFTPDFKRQQIDRVLRGEITISDLGRELDVSRTLLQRWKHLATHGAEAAMSSNGDVVPYAELRTAQARIHELERLAGKQAMELEILRAARDEVKKRPRWYGASDRSLDDQSQ